jgi:hypothetical protein
MPALSSIVNVTVTANTKTVARAGFGVPMVLSYHTRWLDRYRIYTKSGYPTNMTDDNFTTSDTAYQAVGAIFAQEISPERVVVGRRANAFTQTIQFIPTPVAQNYVHSLTITNPAGASETFTVTEGASSTVAALCTAFTSAINGGTVVTTVTATDATTHVSVAADVAGELFAYTAPTTSLSIEDVTADGGVVADFAAVLAEYSDFYGVYLDSQARDENIALAASVANQKMIQIASGFSASNGDSGSTDSEAYAFQNSAYERSAFLFNQDAHAHAGAAWFGRCLPSQPGFITWAHKTLVGVPADTLSTTFETNLLAFDGNSYTTVAAVNITFEGTTGSSYLDIVRTKDWAEARVKESVFGALVNSDKIPFTDKGGALLKGKILNALRAGVRDDDSGAFTADPAPYCIVPKVADILAADKAARNFTGIEWGATLTGAAHTVTIKGTLSLP